VRREASPGAGLRDFVLGAGRHEATVTRATAQLARSGDRLLRLGLREANGGRLASPRPLIIASPTQPPEFVRRDLAILAAMAWLLRSHGPAFTTPSEFAEALPGLHLMITLNAKGGIVQVAAATATERAADGC
jgi:hypothetical protein